MAQSLGTRVGRVISASVDIEAQLPVLAGTLAELRTAEAELKGYVDALLAKKREMLDALEAWRTSRARSTAIAGELNGRTLPSARLDQASAAFDRVFTRETGFSPRAHAQDLEQAARVHELEELVRNNKIEERLARLRAEQSR